METNTLTPRERNENLAHQAERAIMRDMSPFDQKHMLMHGYGLLSTKKGGGPDHVYEVVVIFIGLPDEVTEMFAKANSHGYHCHVSASFVPGGNRKTVRVWTYVVGEAR